MRHTILLKLVLFVLGLLPSLSFAEFFQVHEVAELSINSAITPATLDYLKYQLNRLPEKSLAIVRVNTPGGLVTTTKEIITLIGSQNYPVVVWISPEGASASSAGAIIASSAHFIFMAPGTNMGAATPVGLGEDLKESDGRNKAINDLAALVRSLSNMRGRPSAPFEDMIRKSGSYTDKEALKLNIITGIVSTRSEMLEMLKGRKFILQGKELTLEIKDQAASRLLEPTAGQKILEVLANPSLAYFLFLIGVALIYFEFQAPGGFIAGTAGFGFLILAAISFQVLPLDWGALGLLVLGVAFFILEIFITSYGILSILGLVTFIMGSLFLFHGDAGFISIQYPVILSTLAGVLASVGFIVWYLYKDQKKQPVTSDFFLPIGARGIVITHDGKNYQIKVKGEIWRATSPEALSIGDEVEISEVDNKQLKISIKKVLS